MLMGILVHQLTSCPCTHFTRQYCMQCPPYLRLSSLPQLVHGPIQIHAVVAKQAFHRISNHPVQLDKDNAHQSFLCILKPKDWVMLMPKSASSLPTPTTCILSPSFCYSLTSTHTLHSTHSLSLSWSTHPRQSSMESSLYTPECRQKVKEMKVGLRLAKTCIKYPTLAYTPTKSSSLQLT